MRLLLFSSAVFLLAVLGSQAASVPKRKTKAKTPKPKVMDPAFEGAGQKAGLEIWRIEDFEAVPRNDPKQQGSFHTGDSYIVLKTLERNGVLSWNLHFWLGAETSQDESGAAAIKTVELDDQLGGVPVQYREVQENESNLFLSYFKKGLRYLPGGVKSGFKHVDPDAFEKRLFHVKGKRNIRVKQVDLGIAQMNQGDSFILDVGRDIYVYFGPASRRIERLKATMAANEIRDNDHAGDARVHIGDESAPDVIAKFFEELGEGSPAEVPEKVDDDVKAERTSFENVTLHRVSDEDGGDELYTVKIGEKPLKQDMLQSGDCFILDTGSPSAGIFAWIGKGASKEERVKVMQLAGKFIRQNGYPSNTRINRVVEGAEPTSFKQYFNVWQEPAETIGFGRVYTKEQIAASMPDQDFDISSLHADKRRLLAKNAGKAFGFMPDNGTGTAEIYRIEDFELAPIDEATKGIFFAGDSYVIKYTYTKPSGGDGYVIYFWQGDQSTQDERAASALQAVQLDNDVGGIAVQVRVTQNNEPQHFLTIFKGEMVVMSGGKASGFKNIRDNDTYDMDGVRLFRVRGTNEVDTRAEQRPETADSLASDDVFLLDTPDTAFLWVGKGASEEEKTMGQAMAPRVAPDRPLVELTEGEETDEFWGFLGGKGDYDTRTGNQNPLLSPRLFHVIIKPNGKLRAEQIHYFDQGDLNTDDTMILDTGDEVYVWMGDGADEEEKTKGFEMAKEYIATDPTERQGEKAVILKIKQGNEPAGFKLLFPSWDPDFWQYCPNVPTLDSLRAELDEANAGVSG